MSDKSQNSQSGTMESDAMHVEETESITQSQEVDDNMQTALNSKLELIRKSSIFPLVEMHGRKPLFSVVQAKQLRSIEISLTSK